MGGKMSRTEPSVAYLDHSTQPGGAQLALARLLTAELTPRILVLPPQNIGESGAYSDLLGSTKHKLVFVGCEQSEGATTKQGLATLFTFGKQLVRQAFAIRRSEVFNEATILHANSARAALYGALACFGTKKRLVVHLRDMVDPVSLGKIGFYIFRLVALARADAVIANSNSTLASAEPYLKPAVIRAVIPSPIGIREPSRPGVIAVEAKRFGMVARIDTWKGHETVIRAFATAFRGTDKQLLFAGDAFFGKESLKNELVALASSLNIASQVTFLGHVKDVQKFIESLDVCLHASTRPEPLGQNVLQYLKLGLPTIAAAAGGPAEWITSDVNGVLVPMGDVTRLSDAMLSLSNDYNKRKQLALEAAKTPGILTDYEVCARHNALYERLLS